MERADYRQWGDKFNQAMAIRRQMMNALGIVLPKQIGAETREAIRKSMIGCATCDQLRSCAAWLRVGDGNDGPPTFCPNRASFLHLMEETGG